MALETRPPKDPYAELVERASQAGVSSSTYLKKLLAAEQPRKKSTFKITKENEHLFGPVSWKKAKKLMDEGLASLDAGKGIPISQVRKNLEKVRAEWLRDQAQKNS